LNHFLTFIKGNNSLRSLLQSIFEGCSCTEVWSFNWEASSSVGRQTRNRMLYWKWTEKTWYIFRVM